MTSATAMGNSTTAPRTRSFPRGAFCGRRLTLWEEQDKILPFSCRECWMYCRWRRYFIGPFA